MKYLIILFLVLLPARSLYIVGWTSQLPVEVEKVEVTGGRLESVWVSGDGMSGTVSASAPIECVTVRIEGHTTTGAAYTLVRSWDAGCYRVMLPLMVAGAQEAHQAPPVQ